jgi:hypothetical protein
MPKLLSWEYFPQLPNDQDFQSNGIWIKRLPLFYKSPRPQYKNMCNTWTWTFMLQWWTSQHWMDICPTVKCTQQKPADRTCTFLYILKYRANILPSYTPDINHNSWNYQTFIFTGIWLHKSKICSKQCPQSLQTFWNTCSEKSNTGLEHSVLDFLLLPSMLYQ